MTTFIEVISASAPHIYHSALPLAPRASIVRKLYESYACPLARIVRGLPNSWEPITATGRVEGPVWSPCGRFIAIPRPPDVSIDVMDGTTLAKLNTLSPGDVRIDRIHALSFSPDSRLLTALHDTNLTSWDLQTGGCIGTPTFSPSRPSLELSDAFSCTHSVDGKIIAVAHQNGPSWTISTFDILSGTCACSHRSSELKGQIVGPIWTHGEHLRFAVVKEGSIVVQETGFTSSAMLEVESFPALPDSIERAYQLVFLPSLSRIAFSFFRKILMWDARHSKILLKHRHSDTSSGITFSSDGQFFAAVISSDNNIYLWKNSSAGYVFHRKYPTTATNFSPILSPDGESIILHDTETVQLWPTSGQLVHPPVSTTHSYPQNFILEFSPDGTLAAAARPQSKSKVTVLDLKSGDPRLVLDVNGWVRGLGLTESSLVVVSDKKIVTWNIPLGGRSLSEKWKILRSPQTEVPYCSRGNPYKYTASVSPSLGRIAVVGAAHLWVFNSFTGHLVCTTRSNEGSPWFAQDGCEIWSVYHAIGGGNSLRGWKIIEDSEPGSTKLTPLGPTVHPSGGLPWKSRHGHEVTPDGWVRSSSGKLLLWLPGRWRSNRKQDVIWRGQLVGLLRAELSEPVIIELSE